ncbi:hypothetical protein IQ07DRAFT_605760 [Pyrenochaeta sp. DS3sAY3a]|nr:hypothetical protein IQ07DRAFT_605760 [Pyrenochaeta sp. DS3sAY3a]
MSPIARYLIQITQRIKDATKRNNTLKLMEEATKKPELAHFTTAILILLQITADVQKLHTFSIPKNPSHTSPSDPIPHATALLATDDQAKNNKSQTVHIYHEANHNYTGHILFEEKDNKTSDK